MTYREGQVWSPWTFEPMMSGPDLVDVPDADSWRRLAPAVFRDRRDEVMARLKAVKWNRELKWQYLPTDFGSEGAVPGSLESTKGGAESESKNLFAPGSELTFEQAREIWIMLARRFASGVSGKVTIFADKTVPNSVFQVVELPTLRANPAGTLEFR